MINEPTHRGRLKDVICITGRKHSAAAGHNAAKATIWKIELYEGSVFQTVFQFLAFPRPDSYRDSLRLPAVMQILSFGQFCTDAARHIPTAKPSKL